MAISTSNLPSVILSNTLVIKSSPPAEKVDLITATKSFHVEKSSATRQTSLVKLSQSTEKTDPISTTENFKVETPSVIIQTSLKSSQSTVKADPIIATKSLKVEKSSASIQTLSKTSLVKPSEFTKIADPIAKTEGLEVEPSSATRQTFLDKSSQLTEKADPIIATESLKVEKSSASIQTLSKTSLVKPSQFTEKADPIAKTEGLKVEPSSVSSQTFLDKSSQSTEKVDPIITTRSLKIETFSGNFQTLSKTFLEKSSESTEKADPISATKSLRVQTFSAATWSILSVTELVKTPTVLLPEQQSFTEKTSQITQPTTTAFVESKSTITTPIVISSAEPKVETKISSQIIKSIPIKVIESGFSTGILETETSTEPIAIIHTKPIPITSSGTESFKTIQLESTKPAALETKFATQSTVITHSQSTKKASSINSESESVIITSIRAPLIEVIPFHFTATTSLQVTDVSFKQLKYTKSIFESVLASTPSIAISPSQSITIKSNRNIIGTSIKMIRSTFQTNTYEEKSIDKSTRILPSQSNMKKSSAIMESESETISLGTITLPSKLTDHHTPLQATPSNNVFSKTSERIQSLDSTTITLIQSLLLESSTQTLMKLEQTPTTKETTPLSTYIREAAQQTAITSTQSSHLKQKTSSETHNANQSTYTTPATETATYKTIHPDLSKSVANSVVHPTTSITTSDTETVTYKKVHPDPSKSITNSVVHQSTSTQLIQPTTSRLL
ncbi:uncharacterized protein [Clytia hemisphaerica]|uniref:uncharacterized protein n=1 Tax=Clytia hemisphaerica TaxID=252671 RepID=UPI0034D3D895